jgi:hypothetical protein
VAVLYRAVDQFGQVIDVLVCEQRDTAAARRFFTRALRHGPARLASVSAVAPEIAEGRTVTVRHGTVRDDGVGSPASGADTD